MEPESAPLLFVQNKYPKVLQDDLAPARWPRNPAQEWNPPGHGDLYTALHSSGMLARLLNEGIRYAFIANSDNLGAAMTPALLGYFAAEGFPFMMEVAQKTPSDVKGGHLARLHNGRLTLRESAQCPQEELDAFRDIERYRFFNTNNIWVDLEAVAAIFRNERIFGLPLIVNPKTLDPRDGSSPAVYQIETAMGSAISLFAGATAVEVSRSRFLPVKMCADLMVLRSDRFQIDDEGEVIANPRCTGETISITLDSRYYRRIEDFDARFSRGVPSLVDCRALRVEGDIYFESNVQVRGNATVVNRGHTPAAIAAGTVIDGDLTLQ
jgi:UTP--glucose-1-phosphate uridylyltransferase